MADPIRIIVIVAILIIVGGGLASWYLITNSPFTPKEVYNKTTFNLKVYDEETPINARYLILEENKGGDVKKDFTSQISLIPKNNYTLYLTSEGYYSKKILYIPQLNINTIDIQLTKIGNLNVIQRGSVKEGELTLSLSGEIHDLSYCISLSNNVVNAYEKNNYESCNYQWLNYKSNDTFNLNVSYYQKGVYRCPYSYETINKEDYRDKVRFCEDVTGNSCYKGTIPMPKEYERKTIKCFNVGDLPKTINLQLKSKDVTNEDFVELYYFDKDLVLNNGIFSYDIGNFKKSEVYH